jgi:hypothetical protein
MGHEPHEIKWCVIACTTKHRVFTMKLPESLIDFATRKGWKVLIRDSEMYQEIDPAQSNPNRTGDPEC